MLCPFIKFEYNDLTALLLSSSDSNVSNKELSNVPILVSLNNKYR